MANIKPITVSVARIRELFDYEPLTGEFINKRTNQPVYRTTISVDGEYHKTVRYIWLHYYGVAPTCLIDHRDRNYKNNKINNLREATHTQNQYNKKSFGQWGKGVTFKDDRPRSRPWQAKIRLNGNRVNLGCFATREEAETAYINAAKQHHGEFYAQAQ